MPSRRRTTSPTRRPRVAGIAPDGTRADADGATVTEVRTPRPDAPRPDAPRSPAPHAAPAAPGSVPASVPESAREGDAEGTLDPAGTTRPTGRSGRRRQLAPAAGAPRTGDPAPRGRDGGGTEGGGTDGGGDEGGDEGRGVADRDADGPGPLGRLRRVPVLAGALAVLLALSVFFAVSTLALRNSSAAANTALTDVGTTSEVATQLGDALETVYSYDFARLDENERAAREVITTEFSTEFDRLFAQVRELAPQQQAIVSATVSVSAVQRIEGDRAVLVAFMDQQATTVADAEQAAAAGRLTVTGERVDGRWKIAAVESR